MAHNSNERYNVTQRCRSELAQNSFPIETKRQHRDQIERQITEHPNEGERATRKYNNNSNSRVKEDKKKG